MSGDDFRRIRNALKLKQGQFSALLDVRERGIRRWQKNETEIPSIAQLAMRYVANQKLGKGKR